MKAILLSITMTFFFAGFSWASIDNHLDRIEEVKGITISETFKIYAHCDECRASIEAAVSSLKGVKKAEWDPSSMIIEVVFNTKYLTLDDIKSKIAEAGYDTLDYKATDEAKANLPDCCKKGKTE